MNEVKKEKVITLEDRIPKIKQKRKQKTNRRIIAYVSFFFLIILCIVYFQSPLSKISSIKVTGNVNLATNEIIKLSGLSKGTSFWGIDKDEVIDKIEAHKEVKSVSLIKKLPNKVQISILELKRIAYIATGDSFYPVLENGYVMSSLNNNELPSNAPILFNWKKDSEIKEMVTELDKLPEAIQNSISEIHLDPKDTDPWRIRLFMTDGYEVVGTIRGFAENMTNYPAIVKELDSSVKGVIDIEVPALKPYEIKGDDESESEG